MSADEKKTGNENGRTGPEAAGTVRNRAAALRRQAVKSFRLNWRAQRLVWKVAKGYTILDYTFPLLNVCSNYWNIIFSARLLDAVLYDRDPAKLFLTAAALLGGNALIGLLRHLIGTENAGLGFGFRFRQRMIFGEKLMSLDYEALESEKVQAGYKRVERETFNDGKNLSALAMLPDVFANLLSIGIALGVFAEVFMRTHAMRGWLIAGLAFSLFGIWLSAYCDGGIQKCFEECQEKISENCVQRDGYMEYFGDYQRGKEIRIFQLGRLLIGKLMDSHHFNDRMLDERNRKCMRLGCLLEAGDIVVMAINRCVAAAAALAGWITVGGMMQYVEVLENLAQSVHAVAVEGCSLWYNAHYLERYFEFLDMPVRGNRRGSIPVEKRMDGDYRIRFEHVSFRYPGSEEWAVRDLSMEFTAGEKLAVVGMNGSGKSTFIKLLCRLYDPDEGTIYMNDIDIRRYDYREYLSLFSVVFQDFKLFSFTLGENVAVAEDYDREQVKDALEKAGLGEFLQRHEKGLDTVLYRNFDSGGVEISGGEAQKIALARAVCKGAALVILDEPTAALDPVSEYEIYRRFNDLVADRTTVYISHRMSSCRFCRDIAVFDRGRLVQRGSHEELMGQTGGKYYELWTAQAQHYVAET